VDAFVGQVRAGALRPGDKLPSEAKIVSTFGVSRTVVREALSRLQAMGVVATRHGVGTFALEAPAARGGFKIQLEEVATLLDVIAVLELRIGTETEAAGLAAARRTEQDLAQMRASLDEFERDMQGAGDTIGPDLRFHLGIAAATGNRYYVDLINHLGATLIPRARVNSAAAAQEDRSQYLSRVNREHDDIFAAILRRDPDAARAAMRTHLSNSRERLRKAYEAVQS